MAYTSLVEALGEQKRRAKLQGRPPTTGEVRGVTEGYFGAQAGRQLQQRELVQRETLQATDIEAKKELQATELAKQRELQATELAKQRELQAEQLAQQKELEENRLAEQKATRQAQMAAAEKAEKREERTQKGTAVAAGVAAGIATANPIVGVVVWAAATYCIIISSCTSPDSYEVQIARAYRDEILDRRTLGGYYRLCKTVVPWIKRSKIVKGLVKRCLVDRLIDYGEKALGHKPKRSLKTSWLVTEAFLALCYAIGVFVDTEAQVEAHK